MESVEHWLEIAQELQSVVLKQVEGSNGSALDNNESYKSLRQELLKVRNIGVSIPRFIRENRELTELWPYLRDNYTTYATRRTYVRHEFRPLLDHLEALIRGDVSDPLTLSGQDNNDEPPNNASGNSQLSARGALRNQMDSVFGLDDIRIICHDLSVDYDNLSGDTKEIKIKSLIEFLARRNRLTELIQKCKQLRPEVFL